MTTLGRTSPAYSGIRVTAYANPELVFAQVPITRFQQSVTPSDTDTKVIGPTYSDSVTIPDLIVIYDGLALFDSYTPSDASSFWPSIVATPNTVSTSDTDAKTFSIPDIALGLDAATVSDLIELLWGRGFSETVTMGDGLNPFVVSSVLADSFTPTESLGRTVTFIRDDFADGATASDGPAFSVVPSIPGDSVTVTDSILVAWGVFLADGVSTLDSIVLSYGKAATDSATVTEGLALTVTAAPLGIMNASAFNVRALNR